MITGMDVSSLTVTQAGAQVLSWLLLMAGITMLFVIGACASIVMYVKNHWKD